MTKSAHEHPRRGEVYLANVPFVATRRALRTANQSRSADKADEAVPGFVAEIAFKPRPVLIAQSDAITAQPNYEYVLVAPIYTLKAQHRAKPEFELLLTNRLLQLYYLDRREQGVTHPSYIALAQLHLLHQSMLIEKRGALTAAEMRQIDERLRFCLGL